MPNDAAFADLLDELSPLTKAGIDPDDARMDRAGTMAKLLGPSEDAEETTPWYQPSPGAEDAAPEEQASAPQSSPNGNALPPGLQSRTQTAPADQDAPASAPATVSPSGTPAAPPDLAALNARTIGQMQTDYSRASQDVQNEAAQPSLADQTKVLEQQRVNAQRRQVDLQKPYDPQTGKLLDEYKPSFGQRIMRGVGGFAKGGVFGVVDPTIGGSTAYGAPNKFLAIDQNQAAGRVAGADQQLQNAAANWKTQNERLKAVAKDRANLATMGKDVTGASVSQQGVPIDQQKADTESQNADSRTAEALEATVRDAETSRHNQAAEKQTATYQSGELGIRRGELGVSQGNLGVAQKRLALEMGSGTGAGYNGQNGDDYLKTLSPNQQQVVKATANGDIKIPPPGSRAPGAQLLRQQVLNYDPTYTDARYTGKQQFKTSGDATNVQRLGTAILHANNALKSSSEMGFAPAFNTALQSSDDATYKTDADFLAGEVGQFVTGGKLTVDEGHKLESNLYSPRQDVRDKAIRAMLDLSGGKLKSQREKYKTATGQDFDDHEFFNDPDIHKALQQHGLLSGSGSGAGASSSAKKWDDYPEAK